MPADEQEEVYERCDICAGTRLTPGSARQCFGCAGVGYKPIGMKMPALAKLIALTSRLNLRQLANFVLVLEQSGQTVGCVIGRSTNSDNVTSMFPRGLSRDDQVRMLRRALATVRDRPAVQIEFTRPEGENGNEPQ
jgi:hypothetical protein